MRNPQDLTTLTNSTVSGNSANRGGGIYIDSGTLTVTNSTLTNNTAAVAGGGVYLKGNPSESSGGLTLQRALIAGNKAPTGPEAVNHNGIVKANSHNLFGWRRNHGLVGFAPGASDIVGQGNLNTILNPILTANGGTPAAGQPMLTHALARDSQAIDAAPSAACVAPPVNGIDQRDKPRNFDGDNQPGNNECDIGAFETQRR
jgi:hypothetical protein